MKDYTLGVVTTGCSTLILTMVDVKVYALNTIYPESTIVGLFSMSLVSQL